MEKYWVRIWRVEEILKIIIIDYIKVIFMFLYKLYVERNCIYLSDFSFIDVDVKNV